MYAYLCVCFSEYGQCHIFDTTGSCTDAWCNEVTFGCTRRIFVLCRSHTASTIAPPTADIFFTRQHRNNFSYLFPFCGFDGLDIYLIRLRLILAVTFTISFQGQIVNLQSQPKSAIAMKRKAIISIKAKASTVTIFSYLGHDFGLEFSRSNI